MITLNGKEISEIQSLIKLIDDEESVYAIAKEKLINYGESALEYLLQENSNISSLFLRRRDEIQELILRNYFKENIRLIPRESNGDINLEEIVFLIARQRYIMLDFTTYRNQISQFSKELKDKTSTVIEPVDVFHRIIEFFCSEKQFNGNSIDYYNEENHYINKVLDTKLGSPISLSVIYLLVCRKINLPIYGIGLPGHFILRFSFDMKHIYFDPFDSGKVLFKDDCAKIVENLGYTYSDEFLEPISNKQIAERMLRNIILSLEKNRETQRIETIRQNIDYLNNATEQ
ncbi:MAG: hypothetical protein H3C35_01640 [Bacteroidetes bacterium]|nr:hypothetical protein [Bacteroidota bacterium]